MRKSLLELRDAALERAEVHVGVAAAVRNTDAAAQIDDFDVRESPREIGEQSACFRPVRCVENAAARMRMQPRYAHTEAPRQLDEFIHFRQGHAEFRMRSGRSHVLMMPRS